MEHQTHLKNKKYHDWVKAVTGLKYVKEGLEEFCKDTAIQQHTDILNEVKKTHNIAEVECRECAIKNLQPNHVRTKQKQCPFGVKSKCNCMDPAGKRTCPKSVCGAIYDKIIRLHGSIPPEPYWKNTDVTKWCTDPWAVAKCFINASGYATKSTATDTDLPGLLHLIVNNIGFHSHINNTNVFLKLRAVRNTLFHSDNMELEEGVANDFIDDMIAVLKDDKELKHRTEAREAIKQLIKLKNEEIIITSTNETDAIEQKKKYALEEIEDKRIESIDCLRLHGDKIKLEITNTWQKNKDDNEVLINTTENLITFEMVRRTIDKVTKQSGWLKLEGRQQLSNRSVWPFSWFQKRGLQRRLREDLINFYRGNHSAIPVSPLTDYDVPLIEFYVQSTFAIKFKFNDPSAVKIRSTSYQDLLFCGQELYKEIYVTAKAGVGKTSFAKRLCIVWCEAHSSDKSTRGKIDSREISTLKKFDYLFMIPLRETNLNDCQIEDMIYTFIETYLPKAYSKAFLDNLMHDKQVLIILDGLDEWAHPDNCQRKTEVIPHRRSYPNCSIVTTTRPWKLVAAKLRNSQIDVHAEIQELNEETSRTLIESALELLNKNSDEHKNIDAFEKALSSVKIGPLKFFPYILLQIICLWFGNQDIGKSKCEIYSSVVELTLSRRRRQDANIDAISDIGNNDIPSSMSGKRLCALHWKKLIDLGRLAFESLLSSQNKPSLVFDINVVQKCGLENCLEFFLENGLLSESKVYGNPATRRSTFSFQHKSVQEYLAALYIQSCTNSQDISKQILQIYGTKENLLQMSNVFTFLGGLRPSACRNILQILQETVSRDKTSQRYRTRLSGRTSLPECHKLWEIMKLFQYMQIDIARERTSNGQSDSTYYDTVEDIVIDDTMDDETRTVFKPLVNTEKYNIKSLNIEECRDTDQFTEILDTFELRKVQSLEKLVISAVPKEQDLVRLLSGSVASLKCLDIYFARFRHNIYKTEYTSISSETIATIFQTANLYSVRLNSIRLIHDDMEKLITFISRQSHMTEVGLCHITCVDHPGKCEGFCLDLTELRNLETLRLGTMPLSDICINSTSLNLCYTGSLSEAVHHSLAKSLLNASNLSTLRLKFLTHKQWKLYNSDVLSKLVHLTTFAIEIPEFENAELTIPPEMTTIELLYFYKVTITCDALENLIKSVDNLPLPVTMNLAECTVTPVKQYERVKNKIKSSQNYRVRFDGILSGNRKEFSFETRKRTLPISEQHTVPRQYFLQYVFRFVISIFLCCASLYLVNEIIDARWSE